MDGSEKWKWPSIDKQMESVPKLLGSNFEKHLLDNFLPKNDIYGDLPQDVYEASEKMGGKRLSVMSSYADPLGYYNKVSELKGKLLADSKYTRESSSRLPVIRESAREQDAGEKSSDGLQEITAGAYKKARSARKPANPGKPSVMSSYADPSVNEIKGKLLAESKYTRESSSRLPVICESAREQDAGGKSSNGLQEITAGAYKKARSARKPANPGKPSNKRKRQ